MISTDSTDSQSDDTSHRGGRQWYCKWCHRMDFNTQQEMFEHKQTCLGELDEDFCMLQSESDDDENDSSSEGSNDSQIVPDRTFCMLARDDPGNDSFCELQICSDGQEITQGCFRRIIAPFLWCIAE